MIIDSHYHLIGKDWFTQKLLLSIANVLAPRIGVSPAEYKDNDAFIDRVFANIFDEDGEKLVREMERIGVDKTCIFTMDMELAMGPAPVSIHEQNQKVIEAARRHPDRLIPFYAIDPRQKNAADLFTDALKNQGIRGLKLHPVTGFFPYDQCCYPLYEKCVEYNIPVVFHSGLVNLLPLKCRFSHPINMDDVAADFPELTIILAHIGNAFWEETLAIASAKPNICVDISAWQRVYLNDPAKFYRVLRKTVDAIGPWRVFFATDGPYLNDICPTEKWMQAIKNPDLSSCPEISFTKEEIDIIMGKGFAKLFV